MVRKRTKSKRLRDKVSEREARFQKGNEHVGEYMGNTYLVCMGPRMLHA